jgi:hypothetical protein
LFSSSSNFLTANSGLIKHLSTHDSDLDVENLRKYIKGKQEMKISTMIKISRALGVDIGYLFEGIE